MSYCATGGSGLVCGRVQRGHAPGEEKRRRRLHVTCRTSGGCKNIMVSRLRPQTGCPHCCPSLRQWPLTLREERDGSSAVRCNRIRSRDTARPPRNNNEREPYGSGHCLLNTPYYGIFVCTNPWPSGLGLAVMYLCDGHIRQHQPTIRTHDRRAKAIIIRM